MPLSHSKPVACDNVMGQNSWQPEGLQPESAAHRSVEQGPRLRGCDRAGACESRGFGALHVALRGRIQARSAWNLLRPPRDAALLVLAIERLLPSPGALPSPILAATHTCFNMLGTLKTIRRLPPPCIPARPVPIFIQTRVRTQAKFYGRPPLVN